MSLNWFKGVLRRVKSFWPFAQKAPEVENKPPQKKPAIKGMTDEQLHALIIPAFQTLCVSKQNFVVRDDYLGNYDVECALMAEVVRQYKMTNPPRALIPKELVKIKKICALYVEPLKQHKII